MTFSEQLDDFSRQYHLIKNEQGTKHETALPGNTFFLTRDHILSMARDDGDSRYPYGTDGFNFWAYASGYMHANEGLLSLFLRASEGQEPKIAFFAGLPDGRGEYVRFSLLSVPKLDEENCPEINRYTVFTPCTAYYMAELSEMRFAVRVYVNSRKEICFTQHVKNLTGETKRFFVSSYFNPAVGHFIYENSEKRWFKEVRVLPAQQDGLESFLVKQNEDISRTKSVSNYGIIKRKLTCGALSRLLSHEETASRNQFVGGTRSSLHTPYPLKKGTFGKGRPVAAFTENAAAGDILHLEIGPWDEIRTDIKILYSIGETQMETALAGNLSPENADSELTLLEEDEKAKQGDMTAFFGESTTVELKEKVFNSFFEHIKKQVEFCSLIKGYIQLSELSLIGIRDIFQAIEGLIFWQPEAGRSKMLEALDFIFPDGRCPRQYTLPVSDGKPPVMDLRPFIDQGVWVVSAIMTYLRLTGDFAFLYEPCGYYEIVDEKSGAVKKSPITDSVLAHLLKITDYLVGNLDFGHTHCLRALYGDWNDALDGLGVSQDPHKEYGTGVSVMASLQLYQCLNDMVELLERLGPHFEDRAAEYKNQSDALLKGLKAYAVVENHEGEKRILHGWGDQRSYLVGSFCDPDQLSRVGLTANAFWVLSKAYDTDTCLSESIISAFSLLDSKYGLKTFEPPFAPDTPGVGRIPKLPAGTAENGAAYIHASLFGIMALFRMGCAKEAWQQLTKSLPFTHDFVSCSPFVMPNSYGYNAEKAIDGESMLDWQTGSANVVLKTLIRFVFGLEPQFDGLYIQPASYMPFKTFRFSIVIRSCRVTVRYENLSRGARTFLLDGEPHAGVYDDVMKLEKLRITWNRLNSTDLEITVKD